MKLIDTQWQPYDGQPSVENGPAYLPPTRYALNYNIIASVPASACDAALKSSISQNGVSFSSQFCPMAVSLGLWANLCGEILCARLWAPSSAVHSTDGDARPDPRPISLLPPAGLAGKR
jgi:hypothetical protein